MSESKENLGKALRMLEAAEASLKSAFTLLKEMDPSALEGMKAPLLTEEVKSYEEDNKQVIEGYFDGQNMIGPGDKMYPVPANYASKSKLVEGDRLKLTIMPNGAFIYKQISPVEREHIKGTLVNEDGQYKVIAKNKSYRVLLASVTYYKGNAGDEVTVILPRDRESNWATIEAVLGGENAPIQEQSQF